MTNGLHTEIIELLERLPFWIKLLSSIVAIILFVITIVNLFVDFEVSLNPMIGTTYPGGEISSQITVSDKIYYDYIVTLAYVNAQPGIHVTIVPPFGDGKPTYVSNIIIKVDNTVQLGQYPIEIIGTGQKKNLVHNTNFILYVTENGLPKYSIPPVSLSAESVDISQNFYASGWMGDLDDIRLDPNYPQNYHSAYTCIKIDYLATGSNGNKWAGIYWQFPENNWGNKPEGLDFSGYSKVTFWARGERGGEKAKFKVGGIDGKATYPDSIQPAVSTPTITLTKDWKEYTIDLEGKDLSHVIGGFVWVAEKEQNSGGATFYIDDMQFK